MSKFIRKQKPQKTLIVKKGELTHSHKIFANEWLIDRNGTEAYQVAYPHIKNRASAGVLAHQLLKDPRVSLYISKRLKRISDNAEINIEWVLKRYKMLVEYSVDDFFDSEGDIKPLNEIPKDKLYAVCGFKADKIISIDKNEEQIKTIIREFKLPDKKATLDSLAKYLGMFEKDNEQKRLNIPIQINVALVD